MIDYATTAQEILETPAPQPDWVRERIRLTDAWMLELETLNLNDKRAKPEFRDQLRDCAFGWFCMERYSESSSGTPRRPISELTCDPTDLLDMVFELQERLFEQGGYRQHWVREEEEGDLA